MAEKKQWKDMTKAEKVIGIIVGVFMLVIIIAILAAVGNDNESSRDEPKVEKASYSAVVTDYAVVDPATLRVTSEVKNTSGVSGKPSCSVIATNDSGTYKGYDVFDVEEVKPGESKYFNANITITKEGASYVTKITTECS